MGLKKTILGITGKARSGKDEFARLLAEELFELSKKRFVLMAYAAELKERCRRDFDLNWEQLWGEEKEHPDIRYVKPKVTDDPEETTVYWTAREILQAYGQFFRTIDPDFWVKELFKTIDATEYENVIITDVRHPNEADPVKNRGGMIIRVTSNREGVPAIHGANHISETAMDGYAVDYTVANDFTLKELRAAAKEVASSILKKGDKLNG